MDSRISRLFSNHDCFLPSFSTTTEPFFCALFALRHPSWESRVREKSCLLLLLLGGGWMKWCEWEIPKIMGLMLQCYEILTTQTNHNKMHHWFDLRLYMLHEYLRHYCEQSKRLCNVKVHTLETIKPFLNCSQRKRPPKSSQFQHVIASLSSVIAPAHTQTLVCVCVCALVSHRCQCAKVKLRPY